MKSTTLKQKRKAGAGRPTKSGEVLVVARVHPAIAKNPTEFYTQYEELIGAIKDWSTKAQNQTSPRWYFASQMLAELKDHLPTD